MIASSGCFTIENDEIIWLMIIKNHESLVTIMIINNQ